MLTMSSDNSEIRRKQFLPLLDISDSLKTVDISIRHYTVPLTCSITNLSGSPAWWRLW